MFATAISEKDKRLIQEGEAKAWTKAEAKMKLEKEQMAKQMKSDGVPHKAISKYTGLSEEEIAAL